MLAGKRTLAGEVRDDQSQPCRARGASLADVLAAWTCLEPGTCLRWSALSEKVRQPAVDPDPGNGVHKPGRPPPWLARAGRRHSSDFAALAGARRGRLAHRRGDYRH